MADDLHSRKRKIPSSTNKSASYKKIQTKPKILLKSTIMTNAISSMEKWRCVSKASQESVFESLHCSVLNQILHTSFRVQHMCWRLQSQQKTFTLIPKCLKYWNKTIMSISLFPRYSARRLSRLSSKTIAAKRSQLFLYLCSLENKFNMTAEVNESTRRRTASL